MATSLAAQLSQIAATSIDPLNLKKQRIAHSQSLIFESKVASSQDFDTIYQICYEGFQELCRLDARFMQFERTLFSPHSKTEDRRQMTPAQNKELDVVLESFLALVGARLLLSPAIKALDWLVRRFRVHEFNTDSLILTFLPYHSAPIFLNLLTILPEDLTPTFKVLYPYKRSRINPPREALVKSAAKNQAFAAALNRHVLEVSNLQAQHHGLLAFWAGIMTEAVSEMLDSARSGRLHIEKQNHEDILLRFLPVLNDGLAMKKVTELVVGCYMITVVFATKAALSETALDSLMEAVVGSWTQDTLNSGIVCLSVLAQQKESPTLPRKVVRSVLKLENLVDLLIDLSAQHKITGLVLGLIAGCISEMQNQHALPGTDFVSSVFQRGLLDDDGTRRAISLILQTTAEVAQNGQMTVDFQGQVSELIQLLNSSDKLRRLLKKATSDSGVDIASLEQSLETVIDRQPVLPPSEDVEMGDVADQQESDPFPEILDGLAKEPLYHSSFLAEREPTLLDRLVQALSLAADSPERLESFTNLLALGKARLADEPQFLSFFARVSTGPYPLRTRVAALKVMSTALNDATPVLDLQGLLPYIIAALTDISTTIRREAGNLIATVVQLQRKAKKVEDPTVWAKDTLYGSGSASLHLLSARDVQKVIDRVLRPNLEGCVLDAGHVGASIERALKSKSDSSEDTNSGELKKSLRQAFYSFLCSHIIQTPCFGVKLRLLKIINSIDKIGSTVRTTELAPLLETWRTFSDAEVASICEKEQLVQQELDQEVLTIVSHKDKEAENVVLSVIEKDADTLRSGFVFAAFTRLGQIWRRLSEERQIAAAKRMLDIAFHAPPTVEINAKETLRNVKLPEAALVDFIDRIPASISKLDGQSPSPKRRRTDDGSATSATAQEELDQTIDQITFILELVDASSPDEHPAIVPSLFQALDAIYHFKSRIQSGMGYLLSLALGSLLAVVNRSKGSAKPLFDTSVVRADLVVDCVRTTDSPQVQNTALLLVAALAVIAPEMVLHSVMPIFTFMGSSVLRKDDDYSVMVIDQTIDQVVPALVQSLRNQKRDIVAGTSELLLSFTAAFDHIPSHRRQRLFEALVTKLGAQDFLFAVLAMLANRHGLDKNVSSLMIQLVSSLSSDVQLITYKKYLDLVRDCLQPRPGISQILLGVGNETAPPKDKMVETLLRSLAYVVKRSSLAAKMAALQESDDQDTIATIRTLFSMILQQVLSLGESVRDVKNLNNASGEVLGSILGVLSTIDFVDTVEVLLKRQDPDLERRVLRLLENRLGENPDNDRASQHRVLEFTSTLVEIIRSSDDILLKHAAVACVDRIAEKYGKKDTGRVVEAAQVIAGDACIGQSDTRIRVMGVLCLASMVDVLGEAIIPALPEILQRSLSLLEDSITGDETNEELHNAVYTLLSALLVQIPFMLSSKNLDQILLLSGKSAAADLSDESDDARRDALKLLAKKVDVKESFGVVERNWQAVVAQGPTAVKESLEVVSIAIEKHPKSATVKNVDILRKLLVKTFDLRREQSSVDDEESRLFDEDDLDAVEQLVNDVAIKMIYKLNDTIFRPMFVQLVDWATTGLGKSDTRGRVLRLTSFYKFLQVFFSTLKSIVTSYASYILDNAVEVLKQAKPSSKESKSLWLAAVQTLHAAFENDQDGFWQSPSHLNAVSGPLISQLARATGSSTSSAIINYVVPAIAELAVATDSPDNHKEMNTAIMKYLRPSTSTNRGGGDSPYTRLAALKAEQALTERLGEDWLALLPEMLPYISELMEDEDETVEREVRKWIKDIEQILGERLDDMLT